MKAQKTTPETLAIGERLKALRIALGYEHNMTAFAKLCGMKQTAWSNYEKGLRVPNREQMWKLYSKLGVSSDYVYFGEVYYTEPRP